LLRFFSHQRQSESEAVAHGQAQLRDTIRALSRDLQECSRTTQQNDSQVALAATRVGAALDERDDAVLLNDARALLEAVAEATEARNAAHQRQRKELLARIEELLLERRSPGRIDPATRLPGPDALLDHLEFLAGVGRLMQSPPVLVLLAVDPTAVDLPADAVARLLADESLRRFFAREHFVARAGETLVAVVLPASDIGLAVSHVEATLAALCRVGVEGHALGGGLATLVPGEDAATWWQRGHDLVAQRPWDGSCRVAAAPGVFD
jgi:hypothetical protein